MANSLAAGKPVSTKGVHVLEQAPLDDLANLSAKTLSSSKEGHGPWRSGDDPSCPLTFQEAGMLNENTSLHHWEHAREEQQKSGWS
uniref:Uncharacterized protein n=1 Tax=Oryza glumipatula TaxID=40148 RepID=A0A0D9Y7U0_9ORYZ